MVMMMKMKMKMTTTTMITMAIIIFNPSIFFAGRSIRLVVSVRLGPQYIFRDAVGGIMIALISDGIFLTITSYSVLIQCEAA